MTEVSDNENGGENPSNANDDGYKQDKHEEEEDDDDGVIYNAADEDGDTIDQPDLFKMTGVNSSLDDGVLEECLTKLLRQNVNEKDSEVAADTIDKAITTKVTVALLEKDHEKGTILFLLNLDDEDGDDDCVDEKTDGSRSSSGNNNNNDNSSVVDFVLKRIRGYISSSLSSSQEKEEDEQQTNSQTHSAAWISNFGDASIEVLEGWETDDDDDDDGDDDLVTEEEAYRLWLLDQNGNGSDENNTNFVPQYSTEKDE
eukprot:CAMPEP_0168201036 /NCGR_PEP_ID=MMETSP0139_2-20121125/23426_1 /TAXON_ID=44445 /ORGANISM="Pseudo-nitzschia australis, Strain 10249 10 AB" /LENGTH=256 /DNA_ID=CAMNT_0008126433 /DNA_START=40 /DNA_END=810 /DNA_ORIENTATION=+